MPDDPLAVFAPLPASPTRGEVPAGDSGLIVPQPPLHLPLDGGGREGVGRHHPTIDRTRP